MLGLLLVALGSAACDDDTPILQPDGGLPDAGSRYECYSVGSPTLNFPAIWPPSGVDVPRNLRMWLMPGGRAVSDLALVGADGSQLTIRRDAVGFVTGYYGTTTPFVELLPLGAPAFYQHNLPVVLPPQTSFTLRGDGATMATYRTTDTYDYDPPAPPVVTRIDSGPCKASFHVTHEPDTMVFAYQNIVGLTGITLTDQLDVVDLDATLRGGTQQYQFYVVDKAGNMSEPTSVDVVFSDHPAYGDLTISGSGPWQTTVGTTLALQIRGTRYPDDEKLDTATATLKSGACELVSQVLDSSGRLDVQLRASQATTCKLLVTGTSGAETASNDFTIDFLVASQLERVPGTPPCPDGSPYHHWELAGTRVCPSVASSAELVWTLPDGTERRVTGTGIAQLDATHLLACTDASCSIADDQGQVVSNFPRPSGFPQLDDDASAIQGFPLWDGPRVVRNRHLSVHHSLPRVVTGAVDPAGQLLSRVVWDGNVATVENVNVAISTPYPGADWNGRWAVQFTSSSTTPVNIYDLTNGALVEQLFAYSTSSSVPITNQLVDPYLRVEGRLYLPPNLPLDQQLPAGMVIRGAAGCLLAGQSNLALWWADACQNPARSAMTALAHGDYRVFFPVADGVWLQRYDGNWEFWRVKP